MQWDSQGDTTTAGRAPGLLLSADFRAILFLIVLCAGFFAAYLALGLTIHEDDIEDYYYPVLVHLLESLKTGQLPLWTPTMFAGFPFLADGSAGTFYPLMWSALLVPREAAIMWLSGLRTALGAVLFYSFARAAGMSPLAATLASVTYTFCGYNVGRWIHLSVAHSTLTLPLGLWALERAHVLPWRRALPWLLLAGVATGLLWLGMHPQAALIASLGLGLYAAFRELWPREPHPWRWRGLRLARTGIVVGAVALGLAAVQLLPMAELAQFSVRAGGVPYAFASTYALPPQSLATLLWPYAFVAPSGFDWGLTNRWESALYVGVLPLSLAALCLIGRRDRTVAFWGAVAVLSLWLAFGRYAPLNLHYWVYQLPGFSIFRVPARFLLLTDLALAVLAGYGLDSLRRSDALPRLGSWLRGLHWALALSALGGLAVALLLWLRPYFVWRTVMPPLYFRHPRTAMWVPEEIWPAILQTWNLGNPRFVLATLLLLGTAVLLAGWRRRPSWRRPELLLGLVTLELVVFAVPFWSVTSLESLGKPNGAVARAAASTSGSDRLLSQRWAPTEPNRLIPYGVRDVNTYGPLGSQRYHEYLNLARYGGNRLSELMAVRWLVAPLASQLPNETQGVRYDRMTPLFVAGVNRPVEPPLLRLDSVYLTRGVLLVGRLTNAADLPQGQVAAEAVLRGRDGEEAVLPIQAGVHLADGDARRADVRERLAHQLPTVAGADNPNVPAGGTPNRLLFVSTVEVAGAPFVVAEMELRVITQGIGLEVFGLSLVGADGTLLPSDRLTDSSQVERLRDERSRLLEVRAPLPRAFLAGEARVLPADTRLLNTMADTMVDPTATVYLEEPFDPALLAGEGPMGGARILSERDDELRLAVEAQRPALLFLSDPYYPGWQATVDGQPAHIYRADYLFRAVLVPAGVHEVRMTYTSRSLQTGLGITGTTIVFLLLAGAWLWRKRG